jgi:hypothetical protein
MPLTDDQRAMLQLLLEGGQSYDDIASLLGIEVAEARSRARAALAEIGGADPDAEVGLTDYLLGQADPIGRADAVRHLQNDPRANELATRLAAQLRLLAPKAHLPDLPQPKRGRTAAPAPPPAAPGPAPAAPGQAPQPFPARLAGLPSRLAGGLGSLTRRQSQLLVGLGTAALLIVVAVLAVAGVFSGGDGDGAGETTTPTSTDPDLTIVELGPLQVTSQATGQATISQAGDQPFVQVNVSGLEPTSRGETYIVWLYASDQLAFPLGFFPIDQSGDFSGPAPIPAGIAPAVRQFGCVDVSRVAGQEVQRELARAIRRQRLPRYSGETVLRGEIAPSGEQGASGADANCAEAAAAAGEAAGGAGTPPTTPSP